MRGAWVCFLALLASGCQTLDVERSVSLICEGWRPEEKDVASRAAECWNLQFGTQIEVAKGEQEVQLRFQEIVCLYAAGRTTPSLPVQVDICPPDRYASKVNVQLSYLFTTLVHELGHVLNIWTHAEAPDAVMSSGAPGSEFPEGFTEEDRRMFNEANPDASLAPPCDEVWIQDGRCSCR